VEYSPSIVRDYTLTQYNNADTDEVSSMKKDYNEIQEKNQHSDKTDILTSSLNDVIPD
jgi:hypothetical protein